MTNIWRYVGVFALILGVWGCGDEPDTPNNGVPDSVQTPDNANDNQPNEDMDVDAIDVDAIDADADLVPDDTEVKDPADDVFYKEPDFRLVLRSSLPGANENERRGAFLMLDDGVRRGTSGEASHGMLLASAPLCSVSLTKEQVQELSQLISELEPQDFGDLRPSGDCGSLLYTHNLEIETAHDFNVAVTFCAGANLPKDIDFLVRHISALMQESCGQLYEPPLHFEDSAAQQLLVVVTLDDPILHKTVELTAADNTLFVIAGGKIHLPGRTPCSLTVLTSRLESTMKHLHALMAKSLDDILGLGPDNLNFPGLPRIVIDAYVPEADGVLRDFHISVPRIVDAESFDSDLGKLLNNLESISGRFLRPVKAALDDVISGPAVVIETNEPDGRREVLGLASKVLWHGAHGQREMLANGDQLPDEIKPYDTDRVNIYSNEDFGNDEFSAVEAKLAAVDWEELASEEPCPPDATRHVFYVRGGDVVTQEYEWQSFVVCDSVSQTENPALRALVDSMLEMRDSSSQKNFYLVDTSKSSHPNSNVHRSWTLNAPPQAPTFDYLQMANGSEALGLQLWLRSELPHNNISDLLYLEAPSAQDPQGTVGNQGILVISDPPCVLSLTSDDIAAINALVSSIDLDETGNSNQECASDKWRHSWRFAGVKLHQVDDAQSCESAPTGLLPLLQDLADRAHTKCGSPALRSLIIEVPDFVTTSATVIPSDAQLFPGFSMHQDKEIVLDHCTVQPQKESLEILKQALDTYLLHVTAGGPLTPWCAHLPWFQFYADVLVSNAQQPSGFSVAFTACGFDTGQRLPIGLIDLFDVLQRYKM